MLGYKVMRIEDGMLTAGADSRQRFPLRKGATISMSGNGVYLSPLREYVITYYSGLAPNEVLLTLNFDPGALITGDLHDREPEVSVREVTIVDYEHLRDDEENPLPARQRELAKRLALGG